jgi:hypothetical protein
VQRWSAIARQVVEKGKQKGTTFGRALLLFVYVVVPYPPPA